MLNCPNGLWNRKMKLPHQNLSSIYCWELQTLTSKCEGKPYYKNELCFSSASSANFADKDEELVNKDDTYGYHPMRTAKCCEYLRLKHQCGNVWFGAIGLAFIVWSGRNKKFTMTNCRKMAHEETYIHIAGWILLAQMFSWLIILLPCRNSTWNAATSSTFSTLLFGPPHFELTFRLLIIIIPAEFRCKDLESGQTVNSVWTTSQNVEE